MTNQIFNYEQWLINEALAPTADNGAVALCSAFSSETNVKDALARELAGGFDTTKKYTFRFRSFADVSNLTGSIRTATVEPITDMTKNDVLIVNDKSITEKGSITLMKADAPGELTITASNNGILTLVRLGKCFAAMTEQGVPSILGAKDWAIKLAIGNPVTDPLARGFNFWVAAPNQYKGTANGIGLGVLILALRSAGMPESWFRLSDPGVKGYYDVYAKPYNESKDYQGALNLLATNMGNALKKNNVIVADTPQVNITNFNTLIRTLSPRFVKVDVNVPPTRPLDLSNAYPVLQSVMTDVATGIAMGGSAESADAKAKGIVTQLGFPETTSPVVVQYSILLKNTLAKGSPEFIADYVQVQTKYTKGPAVKKISTQSAVTKTYGEGQYGEQPAK